MRKVVVQCSVLNIFDQSEHKGVGICPFVRGTPPRKNLFSFKNEWTFTPIAVCLLASIYICVCVMKHLHITALALLLSSCATTMPVMPSGILGKAPPAPVQTGSVFSQSFNGIYARGSMRYASSRDYKSALDAGCTEDYFITRFEPIQVECVDELDKTSVPSWANKP